MSKRCLLVLSTFRYADEAVACALDRSEGRLDVLYVLGHATVDTVTHNVSSEGFLGTAPRAEVENALETAHRDVMLERLDTVAAEAAVRGITVEVEQAQGRFYDLVEARADAFDSVVLVRPPRPFWQRFFGSKTAKLAERLRARGLDVTLVEA